LTKLATQEYRRSLGLLYGVEMAADPAVLQQTSKVPITKEEATYYYFVWHARN
jgi:hypothetical protein